MSIPVPESAGQTAAYISVDFNSFSSVVNPHDEIQIVHDGGLRPLIALLRSVNEKGMRQAAGALANVTVNPKNTIKLVQAYDMVLAHWLHCSSALTTR